MQQIGTHLVCRSWQLEAQGGRVVGGNFAQTLPPFEQLSAFPMGVRLVNKNLLHTNGKGSVDFGKKFVTEKGGKESFQLRKHLGIPRPRNLRLF